MSVGRVQHVTVSVPEQLETNTSARLESSRLFHGYVVSRYLTNGTLAVCNASRSLHILTNASPVCCCAYAHPHVITLHSNGVLQVYNVEANACEQFQQDAALSRGDCVVRALCPDPTGRAVLAGLGVRRLLLWDRAALGERPKSLELTGADATIGSIHPEASALLEGTKALVVNANPGGHIWQLWDGKTGALLGFAESPSNMDSVLTFEHCPAGHVVASCREALWIWAGVGALDRPATGAMAPTHTVRFENAVVTAIHVDDHFVVAGDNAGSVTLHTLTGRLLYRLNRAKAATAFMHSSELGSSAAGSSSPVGDSWSAVHTTASSMDLSVGQQITEMFRNRVNKILRVGRWIVCACEGGTVELLDLFSPDLAQPCDSFSVPGGASAKDLCLYSGKVFALVPRGKGQRPDLVSWAPKTEVDGQFAEAASAGQDLWHSSALDLLQQGCHGAVSVFRRLDPGVLRPDELRAHMQTLSTAIAALGSVQESVARTKLELPLACLQNVQFSLDHYIAVAAKVANKTSGGKAASTKSRESLDGLRQAVNRSFEVVFACSEFIGEVKRKTGVAVSFSEKQPKIVSGANSPASDNLPSPKAGPKFKVPGASDVTSVSPRRDRRQQETAVEEMLGKTLDELHNMWDESYDVIAQYNSVCNDNLRETDRIQPLVGAFTRLRQLSEDLKDVAKDIGVIRRDNPSGQWWETGGEYDDVGPLSPAPAPSMSPQTATSPTPQPALSPR